MFVRFLLLAKFDVGIKTLAYSLFHLEQSVLIT
jgi:hypothetical protein